MISVWVPASAGPAYRSVPVPDRRASSPADSGLRRLPGVAIAAVGTEIVNFV